MFSLLKQRKKLKKTATLIGVEVHRQVKLAIDSKGSIFNNPDEIMYFTGYLDSFIAEGFRILSCQAKGPRTKYIKMVCEGVLPGRLWPAYQQADAALMFATEGTKLEFIKAIKVNDLGIMEGEKDALAFFNNDTAPSSLKNFLLNVGG